MTETRAALGAQTRKRAPSAEPLSEREAGVYEINEIILLRVNYIVYFVHPGSPRRDDGSACHLLDHSPRSLHLNWRRNLLDGLPETPDVASDAHLLRLENARDVPLPPGLSVSWTNTVGLDRDAGEFGLAVIKDPAPLIELARRDPRVRLYRPISDKIRQASSTI